jgi:hypothetical protein
MRQSPTVQHALGPAGTRGGSGSSLPTCPTRSWDELAKNPRVRAHRIARLSAGAARSGAAPLLARSGRRRACGARVCPHPLRNGLFFWRSGALEPDAAADNLVGDGPPGSRRAMDSLTRPVVSDCGLEFPIPEHAQSESPPVWCGASQEFAIPRRAGSARAAQPGSTQSERVPAPDDLRGDSPAAGMAQARPGRPAATSALKAVGTPFRALCLHLGDSPVTLHPMRQQFAASDRYRVWLCTGETWNCLLRRGSPLG